MQRRSSPASGGQYEPHDNRERGFALRLDAIRRSADLELDEVSIPERVVAGV